MIDEILLRNVALIREASMVPSRGLTVLTGESGSGKTAFLSGVKLLVGERASTDMVREGAPMLEVEGRFVPLHANPVDDPDSEVIALRTVAADGRSRVRLNGSMASVGELAEAIGASVDLCGQHEHQQLMRTASQARMLDDWMGETLTPALSAYSQAWREAAAARKRHEEVLAAGREDTARLDEARFTLSRIDAVGPQPGEYEELLAEARRMENMEDLVRCGGGAREAISGEGGALDSVNEAMALLQDAARIDRRLDNGVKALSDACYILEDASREIDALLPDDEAFDMARLEEVQERLSSFQGLMRSFGPTMDEVFAHREQAEGVLQMFGNLDEELEKSKRALDSAEAALSRAADAVSNLRRGYAPEFAEKVNAVLAKLEMPGCSILCTVERLARDRWTATGPDAVSFAFKPTPDAQPRPLARIASGGELSRVTLAVKAVLGTADAADTLVFDEVDAGVGGKTALAVGSVLQDLAATHQVIVVTHLAQIAVLADAHYVVERAGRVSPETRLHEVTGDDRVREIARMLSGTADAASMAHAEQLLREAGN
ncbi:MAG: DNA repair protein RecN [Coriobacteriia bacterium]|nr:DNA repair protein RecN [Coriobacteriia bacterium]